MNMADTLSRKDMEAAIKSGGSVIYKGAIITDVANLPKESELAKTKEEREEAKQRLQAERDALDGQIAGLDKAEADAQVLSKSETAARLSGDAPKADDSHRGKK